VTDVTGPTRLDDLDRRIVAALQAGPRASWSQLGSVVGVSETTVMRRVQRLRDTGVLIVLAAPDPLRCGLGQPVHIYFETAPGEAPALARRLAERSDVRYVSLLAGTRDIMCELIAPGNRTLRHVLMGELQRAADVERTTTAVVLKQFKTNDQWSGSLLGTTASTPAGAARDQAKVEPAETLDEYDTRILEALSADGRRTYADLSHDLNLSETAVARRVAALTAENRVYFLAMVDPVALGFELEVLMHLRVEPASLESVASALAATKEVRYISATTGLSDLTCDAVFRDNDDLYSFITRTVGGIRGVIAIDTDVVLESVKREYRYPLFQTAPSNSAPAQGSGAAPPAARERRAAQGVRSR
jgi:DNA-binding Lrp family transcriptional regulator